MLEEPGPVGWAQDSHAHPHLAAGWHHVSIVASRHRATEEDAVSRMAWPFNCHVPSDIKSHKRPP